MQNTCPAGEPLQVVEPDQDDNVQTCGSNLCLLAGGRERTNDERGANMNSNLRYLNSQLEKGTLIGMDLPFSRSGSSYMMKF